MSNMQEVIVPKSDQINADDLIAGPITVKIEGVQIKGGDDQPVSIKLAGTKKAYRPCKSMSRVLVAAWGPDAKVYAGRSLTLYRDPTVKWGGMEVGGIRISHMSHLAKSMNMALTVTRGSKKAYRVLPLGEAQAQAGAPESEVEAPAAAAPAAPIDPSAEPALIPVIEVDGGFDWAAWAKAAGPVIRAATALVWLDKLLEINRTVISNFKRAAPESGARLQKLIDDKRNELGANTVDEFG